MIERTAYRVAEAAESLGLSVGYTRTLIKSGRLRSVTVGSAVLVPAEALREFTDGLTVAEEKSARAYRAICDHVMANPDASFDLWSIRSKVPDIDDRTFAQAVRQTMVDGQTVITHIKWNKVKQ